MSPDTDLPRGDMSFDRVQLSDRADAENVSAYLPQQFRASFEPRHQRAYLGVVIAEQHVRQCSRRGMRERGSHGHLERGPHALRIRPSCAGQTDSQQFMEVPGE